MFNQIVLTNKGFPTFDLIYENSFQFDKSSTIWLDGINTWLSMQTRSEDTLRGYKKETERFLLWCIYLQKKPFHKIEVDDVVEYSNFLLNVNKTHPDWCGAIYPRSSIKWRPFSDKNKQGLSPSSHDYAMAVLQSLFQWLSDDLRVPKNPFKLFLNKRIAKKSQIKAANAYAWDEVHEIFSYLENIERKNGEHGRRLERDIWIFTLLVMTGMRIHEIVNSKYSDFRYLDGQLFLHVTGKGNKMREIPINRDLKMAMQRYRKSCGFSAMPTPEENISLIQSLRTGGGVSGIKIRSARSAISNVLNEVANSLEDPYLAKRIKEGTPHWLRGSFASELNKQGIQQFTLQNLMGHESPATTAKYVLIDRSDVIDAVDKIKL